MQNFSENNFVIFGVSGWVGTSLCHYLSAELKIPSERIFPISSTISQLSLLAGNLKCYRSEDILKLKPKNSIFFHLAFKGKEQVETLGENNFKKSNEEIRNTATKLINTIKPEALIYSSSGAACTETLKGNPYAQQKKEDEFFFKNLAEKLQIKLLIPRIFNIAGYYINKHEIYAISDLLIQAVKNKKMQINASCKIVRSYIEIFDLYKIIFAWLNDRTTTYDLFETANNKSYDLVELALLVNKLLKNDYPISYNLDSNLADNIYVGNITKQAELCRKYNITLKDTYQCLSSTYEYLKIIKKI